MKQTTDVVAYGTLLMALCDVKFNLDLGSCPEALGLISRTHVFGCCTNGADTKATSSWFNVALGQYAAECVKRCCRCHEIEHIALVTVEDSISSSAEFNVNRVTR